MRRMISVELHVGAHCNFSKMSSRLTAIVYVAAHSVEMSKLTSLIFQLNVIRHKITDYDIKGRITVH